ncbi:MAG: tetratricopeptide repeat protein [Opitutales bacterium]|nr:tetratricopeptide repeat protein [Opitutales bacterium]
MKKLLFLIATVSAGATLSAQQLQQLPIDTQSLNDLAAQMWANPEFREAFIGSYKPLQDVEPEFSTEEKIVLKEEVAPLLENPATSNQAIPILEELSRKPGASAQIDFLLGNFYLQGNRTAQAERAYMAATKKFPNYRKAWKNLGMIYMVTGDYKKALEPVSKSIELGEVSGDNYGYLGVIYMQMEDYISAESAFRNALLMKPDSKQWRDNLFKTMLLQERYEEAGAILRSMLQEDPNNGDYWKYLANVYVGLDKPLEAAEVLEIRDRMGRSDAQSLEMLANIYFNHSLYDVAYNVYDRALNASGAKFDMLFNSANALAAVGEYENSLDLVAKLRQRFATSIDKSDEIDLLVLEASAKRALGDIDAAAEILEKIILEDPMNGRALIELGLYYKNLETPDLPKAVSMFEKAENVQEYSAAAYLEHAKILVTPMQKYRDAVRLLRRAQEIEYKDYVQDYLEKVQRVANRF